MSNKYYTPVIEEFRVGFEYEYKVQIFNKLTKNFEDKWIEEAYGDSLEMFGDCYYLETVEGWINSTTCRVKYLDKQDIESLGFNEITEDTFEKKKTGDPLITYYIDYFQIENSNNIFLRIGQDVLSYEDILFQGYCKNKSELITLLKQLNIS